MKTKISFLTMILSMSVFALILFSCAKEEILPITDTSKISIEPVLDEANLLASAFTALENNFQNEQAPEINMTFKEAMERIDPNLHPDWKLAKSIHLYSRGRDIARLQP
jgi:cell shape-determining protein MreC